tara:strand:- start:162 stop:293 length:132 start_codon:yes stop_codon:yes gene_type:complete
MVDKADAKPLQMALTISAGGLCGATPVEGFDLMTPDADGNAAK